MKNICIKLVKKDYYYIRMHGQQNIKKMKPWCSHFSVLVQDTAQLGTLNARHYQQILECDITHTHTRQNRKPCNRWFKFRF